MEILDLKMNDNLNDWGCKYTSTQKPIAWKDRTEKYDVFKIPVDILVYNAKNGRMFMEARKLESDEQISLEALKKQDPKKFNDEVENIIWNTNSERNIATKRDIEKFGQLEPGVVLDDGTVIDGNRRFTCLRRLHREFPYDERFKYFEAAIIKVDGIEITNKVLKEYELRVQFGADEKVDYNVVNMNMSLYDLIEKSDNKDFDYTTVAELVNKTPGEISKICKVCALIDDFLEYTGTGQLPDQQRIDGVVGKLQSAEINVVAAGIGSVQQFQFRGFGKNAAAIRPEVPDQAVKDLPFVVPGVLVDFRNQERHPEPFNETEQILDGPVLEAVEPGQDTDQTGPGRIGFLAELVENKPVTRLVFRHAVRELVADQTGNEAVPEREMVSFDSGEAIQTAAGSPDDLGCCERQHDRRIQMGDQLIEGIQAVQFAGRAQFLFKGFCCGCVQFGISAGLDIEIDPEKCIGALFQSPDDVPVPFEHFAPAEAKLFDIPGIGGIEYLFQACRGVNACCAVAEPVRHIGDGIPAVKPAI